MFNEIHLRTGIAQVVQETIDPKATIEFRPNTEDDPHKRKPDISKAQELLGWEPTVSLRQGLPRMVSDFRQRIFGDQNSTVTHKKHMRKHYIVT